MCDAGVAYVNEFQENTDKWIKIKTFRMNILSIKLTDLLQCLKLRVT